MNGLSTIFTVLDTILDTSMVYRTGEKLDKVLNKWPHKRKTQIKYNQILNIKIEIELQNKC